MSHFLVLVIGPDPERQLAPFHEFECTGIDDEYVIDVDITDQVIAAFAEPQQVVRLRDGSVFERYAERFYTKVSSDVTSLMTQIDTLNDSLNEEEDPSGAAIIMRQIHTLSEQLKTTKVFSRNKFELPEGAVEMEMSADEARTHNVGYQTLAHCADEHFSAKEMDGKFYRHTNPSAKWDWYATGGRWPGWLKLKKEDWKKLDDAGGIMPGQIAITMDSNDGCADSAIKGKVDFGGMRDAAGAKAAILWDKAKAITSGETWEAWDSVVKRLPMADEARDFYHGQPAIRALKASDVEDFIWEIDDDLANSRDAFIVAARDRACAPYALVRDSKWLARGDMGWFGISHDKVEQGKWNWQVNQLLNELPDDTLLTVIDAHI
jgi:hypothetical protein